MRRATGVPVSEYLSTDYSPDVDYVEGELLERNVGERDHSRIQTLLSRYLGNREKQWQICVFVEQRVQISAARYRVPDICVIAGPYPEEQIFTHPPFLCIEILSLDDRISRMREKIDDYLNFGVSYVWVIDPASRRADIYAPGIRHDVKDGFLRTTNPELIVPFSEIFPG